MPKVSIVMPTYNRAHYIAEAIDSILAQTYTDYEIIVVDDGSVDNTKEVLQAYGDKVRYFYRKVQCQGATINYGISKSRGEYIALLDDDDLWLPNKLEIQMGILEHSPELGFICNETYLIDAAGETTGSWKKKDTSSESFISLFDENYIHAASVVMRKKLFEQLGGFDESLLTTHDYDLWLRLAKICKFKYLDVPLSKYRIHPTNKHKNVIQKIKDRVKVVTKVENSAHLSFAGKRARVAKEYYNYAQHFQNMGWYGMAAKHFLKAVLIFPFIGLYYAPSGQEHTFRSSPFYRVFRTYLKAFYCFLRAVKLFLKRQPRISQHRENWSIGIYKLTFNREHFHLNDNGGIHNPVLTGRHVTDRQADYVADPFLFRDNGQYYMFFEVFENNKGSIGFAVSNNGKQWKYKKVVLDTHYHLSYPLIFKWEDTHYMLPECCQSKSVKLFAATSFPDQWRFVKTLIAGKEFVDPTLVHFNNKFWLFVGDTAGNLYLYFSDGLEKPWQEHPQSPVVKNDKRIARPGGHVLQIKDKLIRIAQDNFEDYGVAVRAFEITKLDVKEYAEKELSESPLLAASGSGWNKDGMHHLSVCPVRENEWIAAVDGKTLNESIAAATP